MPGPHFRGHDTTYRNLFQKSLTVRVDNPLWSNDLTNSAMMYAIIELGGMIQVMERYC